MTQSPKVLILDIETSPIIAYVWGLRDQNISLGQIKQDWHLLAWCAKWLNEKAVFYKDQSRAKKVTDDKAILSPLWKLLDSADVVITQNGERFDGPRLNARFILHGMPPPSPYRHLDTYRIVRSVAGFTSNKLEYLTDKICHSHKKTKHKKFIGIELWKECLAKNKKAWDEMRRYNIEDVLSTEELYNKIKAWIPQSMPYTFIVSPNSNKCGRCGSNALTKQGTRIAQKHSYQRYLCGSCGSWSTGERLKEVRKHGR